MASAHFRPCQSSSTCRKHEMWHCSCAVDKMKKSQCSVTFPPTAWWLTVVFLSHITAPCNPDSKHFRHQDTSSNWCRGHRMSHTIVWVTASNACISVRPFSGSGSQNWANWLLAVESHLLYLFLPLKQSSSLCHGSALYITVMTFIALPIVVLSMIIHFVGKIVLMCLVYFLTSVGWLTDWLMVY